MEQVELDSVVIGAGVIGLAIARDLALRGQTVAVLEAADKIGSGISERNSGVIHAGLYYAPGSLKARLCVQGRDMMYAYAKQHNIWHQQCGKLVVATSEAQIADLHKLKLNAETNGVTDLRLLTPEQAKQMEPEISCAAAMHVPISGMIDVHDYLKTMLADVESNGGFLQLQSFLSHAEAKKNGFTVFVEGGNPYVITCKNLINAAGLQAQQVAARIRGYDAKLAPQQILGKGSYFIMRGKAPFKHLVYPLPQPGTSGLHYRCERDGRAIFGPDLEIVDAIDYKVDPKRAHSFYEAARLYYPKVREGDLSPDYAGIRPKIAGAHPDFAFQSATEHKIPGLIHCYGIESPGVTASMAIGKHVADLLDSELTVV